MTKSNSNEIVMGIIIRLSCSIYGSNFKEITIKLDSGEIKHITTHINSMSNDLRINDKVFCTIYKNLYMKAIDGVYKIDLNKLNCMNYHVEDDMQDFWYSTNGLRSIYNYSKVSDISFKDLCLALLKDKQIKINNIDKRYNTKTYLITMI
jgi:hypothetical protein